MPKIVINGAKLKCSEGTAPSTLTVLPAKKSDGDKLSAATVDDHKPMLNIAPFGMCKTHPRRRPARSRVRQAGALEPQLQLMGGTPRRRQGIAGQRTGNVAWFSLAMSDGR